MRNPHKIDIINEQPQCLKSTICKVAMVMIDCCGLLVLTTRTADHENFHCCIVAVLLCSLSFLPSPPMSAVAPVKNEVAAGGGMVGAVAGLGAGWVSGNTEKEHREQRRESACVHQRNAM
jgi:hypothetical protein